MIFVSLFSRKSVARRRLRVVLLCARAARAAQTKNVVLVLVVLDGCTGVVAAFNGSLRRACLCHPGGSRTVVPHGMGVVEATGLSRQNSGGSSSTRRRRQWRRSNRHQQEQGKRRYQQQWHQRRVCPGSIQHKVTRRTLSTGREVIRVQEMVRALLRRRFGPARPDHCLSWGAVRVIRFLCQPPECGREVPSCACDRALDTTLDGVPPCALVE